MFKHLSAYFFIILLVSGCATTPPYNPFSIEKDEIYASVKTIGIMPFSSEINADELEKKLKNMESIVKSKLENVGFKVVESDNYSKIYDEFKEVMGPMYDAETGKLNAEKYKVLREQTMREYLAQNKIDALFYGGPRIVKASWYQNSASWNGTTEATSGKKGFWANLALGQTSGTIPAISFSTYIERPDKTRLYSLYGGIQLAQWYKGGKFVDVPRHQLLNDETKVNFGIDQSMGALINKNSDTK